jgi:Ca2+-transporting ATPase
VIEAIHTKIEGRARFKVEGLLGSDSFKRFLEQRLGLEKDILSASASTLTGNILVSYNSNNNHHTIAFLLEDILIEAQRGPAESDVSGPHTASAAPVPAPSKARQLPVETLKRFLTPPVEGKEQVKKPWHTLEADAVTAIMRTDATNGMSVAAAGERLKEHGPNLLPKPETRSGAEIFFEQLNSLPVYLLGAAAGISALTGGLVDAVVIGGVVLANAVIGYFTESGAEKTMDSLKELVHPTADVIRDGREIHLAVEEVVVGDVLVLKPGTYVAADSRILNAHRLSVDESMLTGESMPVHKDAGRLKHENTPLADRSNMVYMGTLVTGGQGLAVVVATGRFTEVGMLQAMLSETATPKTPIELQLTLMGN